MRRPAAPERRRRRWPWRYRRLLFLTALAGFAAVAGALFLMTRVPLTEPARLAETTILTDVNGARLASIDSGEDRIPVALDAVPKTVVQAVLAAEDRSFYEHGGLDPVGIVRAAVARLRGRPLQGGSTITQQYVKNVYLGPERTVTRKLREAAIALKVERRYGKDEILERYLNTVYLGRGAYGVQAGARAHFGKDVADLGLAEAAYLAGLIRAPEAADVARSERAARARRDTTLRAMEELGFVSHRDAARARATAIRTIVLARERREPNIVDADKGTAYFVEYVRAELVRRYGKDTTYQGGLRVKTSLDLTMQAEAYDAVYGFLDRPDDPAGALVAVDADGRIRAMVGGRDFKAAKVNYAAGAAGGGSGRQAGSTFKPFLLAAAVDAGYSVQSTFPAPKEIVLPKADDGKDYPVENFEGAEFDKPLNLIDATARSVNTVYVQAQESLGRQRVVDMARQLGVRDSELEPNASFVLGTEEVSVVEMAAAFSTFANRGLRVEPRAILEVRTADGTVLAKDRGPSTERVLSTDHADVVNHCLRQVVLRGSGAGAKIGTPVAGKTGTTQDFADAWFVGYTPKLTAAVWMGYPDGNEHKMRKVRGVDVAGGTFPATIFKRFMSAATKDARFRGDFPTVTRFRGKPLPPPPDSKVVIPTTTTTTAPGSTTTAPASASASGSSTTTAPASHVTTTSTPSSPSTSSPPPPTTTTAPS